MNRYLNLIVLVQVFILTSLFGTERRALALPILTGKWFNNADDYDRCCNYHIVDKIIEFDGNAKTFSLTQGFWVRSFPMAMKAEVRGEYVLGSDGLPYSIDLKPKSVTLVGLTEDVISDMNALSICGIEVQFEIGIPVDVSGKKCYLRVGGRGGRYQMPLTDQIYYNMVSLIQWSDGKKLDFGLVAAGWSYSFYLEVPFLGATKLADRPDRTAISFNDWDNGGVLDDYVNPH